MGTKDFSRDWADKLAPDSATIETLAMACYMHLPAGIREQTGSVKIVVAEYPSEEIADDLGLETPFDLLGLYEGRGNAELWTPHAARNLNQLTLYRRAILDYWCDNDESLGEIVAHVVISELGRHFGLTENEIDRIEYTIN